ncbi:DUF167 domain-containing protein [Salaquimonas pukyongi]|uniref:DUF167 domain-containing protein n=1 Tax=Salaquimonas pukyongi TaxID=2712698 RepID=UPI00096BC4DF|nr:DUF167 family protein [Salaquimonas pukyongi]
MRWGDVDAPYEVIGGKIRLRVRLAPGARTEMLGGVWKDENGRCHLKASVRAVPEKGQANKALIALLAGKTGVAKSRIALESGSAGRLKTLKMPFEAAAGIDEAVKKAGRS